MKSKTADMQPLVGVSMLNVSRLNIPTKRRRFAESILKIQSHAVYIRLTQIQNTNRIKVKKKEMIYYVNNEEKAEWL